MNSHRFDRLTQEMTQMHSRRDVLKRLGLAGASGLAAAVALRAGHEQRVYAARGVTPACARLGQSAEGTTCCPGLEEDTDGVCRTPVGGNCRADSDCVGDATCEQNPHGLGHVCVAG